jgi:hypothetical protein
MTKIIAMAIVGFSALLSGCAATYPSWEDQAAYHVNQAKAAFAKGDCIKSAQEIDVALSRPTGNALVKQLFVGDPKMHECFYGYLEKRTIDVTDGNQAAGVYVKFSTIRESGVLAESQISMLFATLNKVVIEGNLTGSVGFVLGNKLEYFPELKSPSHQEIIVNRTIGNLQKNSGLRPVTALMNYVTQIGVDSVEGRRIESLLTTMNIRRDELDEVGKVFPQFAASRKEELTVQVFLQVKNGDRLMQEDLLQKLRVQMRGVEWVAKVGPKSITVVVERIRNDERVLPERSQTITYAQHEVDTMKAVLLMPRNASFMYELITGGSEIDYGYIVTSTENGVSMNESIVRGKVGGEYRRCQNTRLQNVFGGVSSAGFVANDDMQRRCSGPSSASIEDLRGEVLLKIVESVMRIPSIKVVHELN